MSDQPEPFTLHVPDSAMADLRERLARTRFPDQAPGEPWAYGTDVTYLRGLVEYWRDAFDWRAEVGPAQRVPAVQGSAARDLSALPARPGGRPGSIAAPAPARVAGLGA
jgi:Epoxide hydrolase N terminus